jgi:predicted RNA binding protein YcfA (HicA-like mRNA interferase family)
LTSEIFGVGCDQQEKVFGADLLMKSISGKDFAKVLERHGWVLLQVQGSHHIYGKTGNDIRISVPHSWQSESQDWLASSLHEGG